MKSQNILLLEKWLALFRRIEATYDDMHRVFRVDPESAPASVMYDTHAAYTKLVAEQVGDQDGWLDWFLWENGGGTKGMEAKAANWKRMRKIRTIADLAALIDGSGTERTA